MSCCAPRRTIRHVRMNRSGPAVPARRLSERRSYRSREPGDWFSVRDRLPDQLGDLEDEVGLQLRGVRGCADFANAHAHRIVEPPIRTRVAGVKDRPDDLAAPGWMGSPISVPLEHDHGAVLGLDDGAE